MSITTFDQLIARIQEVNQHTLDSAGVDLTKVQIEISELSIDTPTEQNGHHNTMVTLTALGPRVVGTYDYYYTRAIVDAYPEGQVLELSLSDMDDDTSLLDLLQILDDPDLNIQAILDAGIADDDIFLYTNTQLPVDPNAYIEVNKLGVYLRIPVISHNFDIDKPPFDLELLVKNELDGFDQSSDESILH